LSVPVKNVLYVGNNIQLAEAMLNLSASPALQPDYTLCHLLRTDGIEAILAEKEYTHLICDLPFSDSLADKIDADFPLLKTTYLNGNAAPKLAKLSASMEDLITDEVKTTLDFLSIPIYFKNIKGEFLACNSYFSHIFGLTPAQVQGKNAADILPAHLLDEIKKIDQNIFDNKQVYFYECKLDDINGIAREMVFRKECVDDTDIQIGMLFDVTEINQAKYSLEKERIMLRATADISPDLIFFKDLDSRFLGCNKQFEKFVGCSEEDILGKKDDQLFELGQALMCQSQDKDVISNKQIYLGEEHLTYNDGQRHFIEMKKVPLQDKNGEVQGLIGVGRDITAHHLMQKRLKIAEVVFDNSKDSILVTDQFGDILSANQACCLLSGFSKDELLQLNINVFASKQQSESFYDDISFTENKSWQGDITYCNKNGDTHFAWLEIYAVDHFDEGKTNRIYSFTDLTQCKRVEEKIQFLSKHDPLTGLYNRIALFNRLEDSINRANYQKTIMAVLLVDINDFKAVNDQFGHNAGDDVLKEIAIRLKNCIFEKETVARFSDHSFVIVVNELANEQNVASIAQKIITLFSKNFTIGNREISLSATIGISMCPDDGIDNESLLSNAEKAMQRGKDDKSVPYHFYTMALTRHSNQQLELEDELKLGLQLDQFELYYQPQYDLNNRQIVAMQGLLRWNHPEQGVLQHDRFLILAKESGLLVSLGLITIRKAALQAVNWHKAGINFGRIAINLSREQLSQLSFIADLHTILKETMCSGQWLEFEVEKSTLHHSSSDIQENLMNIRKMGIGLTVINFGISSTVIDLINLLGVEKLRIANDFIKDGSEFLVNDAVYNSSNIFARTLGLSIVGDVLEINQQQTPSTSQSPSRAEESVQVMKASEATFYLRCNKRH
jgi:diguanylate cyclase (GGDEF)-like protein/PAS domain S-box-containing protein